MLAAFVSWGALPQWLILFGVIFAAWTFHRGGGGSALEVLERANRILTEQHRDDTRRITELEQQRNLEPIVEAVVRRLDRTDTRAQERQEQILEMFQAQTHTLEALTEGVRAALERVNEGSS